MSGGKFIFKAETSILDALELGPKVEEAFRGLGLKCPGKPKGEWCAAVEVETLSDASRYHEIDLQKILDALNALDIPTPPPKPPEE